MRSLISTLVFLLSGVAHGDVLNNVSVMTYNVENLFDTIHDPGKNDYEYLPQKVKRTNPEYFLECDKAPIDTWKKKCRNADWTKRVLTQKMKRLARVITQANNQFCPDILILQEVEKQEVVELLRTRYLKRCLYQDALVMEGKDERGVDVGFLSKYPFKKNSQKMHFTEFSEENQNKFGHDTRPIYQVTVIIQEGIELDLLGVHMPAQFLPAKMREKQILDLNQIQAQLGADRLVLAAGDFNISFNEEKELFDLMEGIWGISHRMATDLNEEGTHYFRDFVTPEKSGWSFLDAILVSEQLKPFVQTDSIKVFNSIKNQKYKSGAPWRFRYDTNQNRYSGFSDHFPLVLKLQFPNSENQDHLFRRKFEESKWSGKNKIKVAFFDADSTLRITKSGKPSADFIEDVVVLPGVAQQIKKLNDKGFFVAIVSNQGGVPKFVSLEVADGALNRTAELIKAEGGRVDYIDFATARDVNRKGNPGMAMRLQRLFLQKLGARIDWKRSFMVGDAAYKDPAKGGEDLPVGRRVYYNFSNSDRKFAERVQIPFYEPCDYFGWWEDLGINVFTQIDQIPSAD